MTNKEAIKMLTAKVKCMQRETSGTDFDCNFRNCYKCDLNYGQSTMGDQMEALDMAISALQAQEVKQEAKKSRCTYKPDCPWYDGSKCNSPNDHGYHECDYDRGIFPESYEEEIKNSLESSLTQKALDTISRQAVINELLSEPPEMNYGFYYAEKIKALPPAEPEPQWIPISERLPEDGTDCLVSVRCSAQVVVVDRATYSADLFTVDKEDFFDNRGESGWYYFSGEYGYCKVLNVIAWMPLPEPYRAERRTDE